MESGLGQDRVLLQGQLRGAPGKLGRRIDRGCRWGAERQWQVPPGCSVDSYSQEPSLHGESHKHTQLEVRGRCEGRGLATSDQIRRSELDHVETRMEGSPVRKRIPL